MHVIYTLDNAACRVKKLQIKIGCSFNYIYNCAFVLWMIVLL